MWPVTSRGVHRHCYSLSFNWHFSYPCSLLSQIALTIAYPSILVYRLCDSPALTVLSTLPYWPNAKVRSRNRLHVGGSALAPCPTAQRVQGCLLGVTVPVRHCSNLTNWSVLISVGYYKWSLPMLCGKGVLSVPFACTTLMQVRALCVNGLPLELRLLSRTLSDIFYCHLKTVLFGHAGVGSASE